MTGNREAVAARASKRRPDIILAGGYPPPYGGITVHIQRLAALCSKVGYHVTVLSQFSTSKEDEGTGVQVVPCRVAGLRRGLALAAGLLWRRRAILHLHLSDGASTVWAEPLLHLWRFSLLVTVHSGAFGRALERFSPRQVRAVRCILRRADAVVGVSPEIVSTLISQWNVPREKTRMIPAYVKPAAPVNTDPAPELLGAEDLARRFSRMAVTSGYLDHAWGLGLVCEILDQLEEAGAAVVFVSYGTDNPKYARQVMTALEGRANAIMLRDLRPDRFTALLKSCSVYLRPSYHDGDSVAVREALHQGARVVASDGAIRPAGCHLFRTGDSNDMLRAFREAVSAPAKAGPSYADDGFEQQLLQLYESTSDAPESQHGYPRNLASSETIAHHATARQTAPPHTTGGPE